LSLSSNSNGRRKRRSGGRDVVSSPSDSSSEKYLSGKREIRARLW
ncbi:9536_t:CDS:1, partial [Funneliformis caledonium]